MLLSEANMRGSKAAPVLYLADLARLPESTVLLAMPPRPSRCLLSGAFG